MKLLSVILGAIAVAVVLANFGAVGGTARQSIAETHLSGMTDAQVEDFLQGVASKANERLGLPTMIDSDTRLDSVEDMGNEVRYNYREPLKIAFLLDFGVAALSAMLINWLC